MASLSSRVRLITICEMPEFIKQAKDVLSEKNVTDLKNNLAANPEIGSVITGSGGIRKLRVAALNKGKSGGARVIYYYHNDNFPLYLLTLYPKSDKIDLSDSELAILRSLVDIIVKQPARRQK